jgi:electron transfer flavoprotein alpha subunit
MGMDLSYLEALMGGGASGSESGGGGGVWVVSPEGALDDGILRLVGKARVLADALGGYVYLLLAGGADPDAGQTAIHAGADRVVLAGGVPALADLVDFFGARSPQVVLLPHTYLGRSLGPGLGQRLGGGVVGGAADLALDPGTQRVVAQVPVMGDAARQNVTILDAPAVVIVDTQALPAAFSEPWRTGEVEESGLTWGAAPEYPAVDWPAFVQRVATAPIVVAGGRALKESGFELAGRLASRLGGALAGDTSALDAGWIDEEQLVDITGQSIVPRLYLALGISGETTHFMAIQGAGTIIAVQPDPGAPITQVADWNILADPAQFVQALLEKLGA